MTWSFFVLVLWVSSSYFRQHVFTFQHRLSGLQRLIEVPKGPNHEVDMLNFDLDELLINAFVKIKFQHTFAQSTC
ncbi:hypothetical protein R6Q59_025441 [Mikania micrantha]